eukprot:7738063-Alexandrium_andersonii.AAC.1
MECDPVLTKKGDRVGLCRFMGAIYKAKHELGQWHKRAWTLQVVALQLGYEAKQKRMQLVGKDPKAEAAAVQ